jgi:hypothetical protein
MICRQWQGQRDRLADSPQAGRKAAECREEDASSQVDSSRGKWRQAMADRQR